MKYLAIALLLTSIQAQAMSRPPVECSRGLTVSPAIPCDDVHTVPVPATGLLIGAGFVWLMSKRRRK